MACQREDLFQWQLNRRRHRHQRKVSPEECPVLQLALVYHQQVLQELAVAVVARLVGVEEEA